jgi:hypothetical protein
MYSIKPVPTPVRKASTRLTITLPGGVFEKLVIRSNDEGRSISNLAAYLIETSLESNN